MIKKQVKKLSCIVSGVAAVLVDRIIPDSASQPKADASYFVFFLYLFLGIYFALYIASLFQKTISKKLEEDGPLIAGGVLILNGINIVCSKLALLPILFFPSLDRVFGVFVNDRVLILECILSSGKLLIIGYAIGALLGFATGLLLGFHKKAAYWINPVTKIIGPIPATSWSPLVLSLFSTSYQAAVFMIALSVWFPITVMTSSGIQNVQQTYFEVADTLGSGRLYKVFRVGVPAAMPSIFLGFFYATTGSFVTLVTAEMFGCKSGIGWYLNWQKSMMLYANVYAGLIILAVLCNLIIKILFWLKDSILIWQKGVIKW
ncbi:ABC transporter permease [[Clostridium] polysaccharolyticum]|uniref:NitT/TauT family transport system permease protein n=1 Tax=[Clostridium] polysaccharolyticum TaxID=29364 RepID=A0A1I0AB25_9FIRM|nr:ABC transporter permease subunit [[Clostridium] polysaccharolyticum]SES91235.1 NitT/TauT family transport system permease protein [[Clostridium] polysaccharolyticum]